MFIKTITPPSQFMPHLTPPLLCAVVLSGMQWSCPLSSWRIGATTPRHFTGEAVMHLLQPIKCPTGAMTPRHFTGEAVMHLLQPIKCPFPLVMHAMLPLPWRLCPALPCLHCPPPLPFTLALPRLGPHASPLTLCASSLELSCVHTCFCHGTVCVMKLSMCAGLQLCQALLHWGASP